MDRKLIEALSLPDSTVETPVRKVPLTNAIADRMGKVQAIPGLDRVDDEAGTKVLGFMQDIWENFAD